jgi:hypothetical protein
LVKAIVVLLLSEEAHPDYAGFRICLEGSFNHWVSYALKKLEQPGGIKDIDT